MNIIQSYVRNDVQQLNLFVVECKQLPKNKIKDIKVGLAGEYLVMSKLIRMGYSCALSGNGEPYDILVDIPKAGIQKIQIKTNDHHGLIKYLLLTNAKILKIPVKDKNLLQEVLNGF